MIGDTNETMAGLMIGGPNGTAFLPADCNPRMIEAIIYGMCKQNGDEPEDYTVTDVVMQVNIAPQALVTEGV